jgi:hypothetical protein
MTTCEITATVVGHAIQVPDSLEGKRVRVIVFVEDDAEMQAGNQGVAALLGKSLPAPPGFTPLSRDACHER